MKKNCIVALVTGAAVLAVASGGAAHPSQKTGKGALPTLKIGTVLPFTGVVAESAREMQKTFGMYLSQHGGLDTLLASRYLDQIAAALEYTHSQAALHLGLSTDCIYIKEDKSLVVAEQMHGHSRSRLLESVRQYAREKLLESGAGEAVREQHRDYYLALAEEAHPKLISAEQADWLRRLEEEHENLRAGLNWSVVEAEHRERNSMPPAFT